MLADSDYRMAKFDNKPKVKLGNFNKDTGKATSRMGDICGRSAKLPAPNKYQKVQTWIDKNKTQGSRPVGETCSNYGFAFSKASRFIDFDKVRKKQGNMPDPGQYERKDVAKECMNSVKPNLSDIRRPTGCNMPRGMKKSAIDKVMDCAPETPQPHKYAIVTKEAVQRNKLTKHIPGFEMAEKKSETKKDPKADEKLAPNHYAVNYDKVEDKSITVSIGKEVSANFVDQCVRSRKGDVAPGTYEMTKLEKISRGTKFLQVHNFSKGPLAGKF